MSAVIKRAWRGEEGLGIVFWGYNIVLPLAMWLLLSALKFSLILLVPAALGAVIVLAWAMVALWRTAPKGKTPNITMAARAFIAVELLLVVWIASDYLRKDVPLDMSLQKIVAEPMTLSGSGKCLQKMSDFATQRQVNADSYINANRAFLDKCIAYYTANPTAP